LIHTLSTTVSQHHLLGHTCQGPRRQSQLPLLLWSGCMGDAPTTRPSWAPTEDIIVLAHHNRGTVRDPSSAASGAQGFQRSRLHCSSCRSLTAVYPAPGRNAVSSSPSVGLHAVRHSDTCMGEGRCFWWVLPDFSIWSSPTVLRHLGIVVLDILSTARVTVDSKRAGGCFHVP